MTRFRARGLTQAHVASLLSVVMLFPGSSSHAEEIPNEPASVSADPDGSLTPPVPSAPPGISPALATVENGGADCAVPALPTFDQLQDIEALPDPFTSLDGTRIAAKQQWACRRAELSALIQEFELGPKPTKPSIVTGAFADGRLSVSAGEPDNIVTFSAAITRPADAPQGPIPLVITLGGSSLTSEFTSRGVASLSFNNGAMGAQGGANTRGQGTFYQLYGSDHAAGSMIAWAWGVSRIIDALEITPAANIDTHHIAVTGCSRNGKGALVAGAFDERIALTVPQESGAGGSASWRISQVQHDAMPAETRDDPNFTTQTVRTAQGEQPWFRANFGQFATPNVPRLPHDHHELMGMVAPRALFVLDNTDMNWLGNESSFTDAVAAAEVWNALGLTGTMGASQVGGHAHCNGLPQDQLNELGAFVDKFLLGRTEVDTNVLRSDRIQPDRARWLPWSTPALR